MTGERPALSLAKGGQEAESEGMHSLDRPQYSRTVDPIETATSRRRHDPMCISRDLTVKSDSLSVAVGGLEIVSPYVHFTFVPAVSFVHSSNI